MEQVTFNKGAPLSQVYLTYSFLDDIGAYNSRVQSRNNCDEIKVTTTLSSDTVQIEEESDIQRQKEETFSISPTIIIDKYPSDKETRSSQRNEELQEFQAFRHAKQSFRRRYTKAGHLTTIPEEIQNMIDLVPYSMPISTLANELELGIGVDPLRVDEAFAFLWVYVGAVQERMEDEDYDEDDEDIVVITPGHGRAIKNLIKSALTRDKDKNMRHILRIWKQIKDFHSPLQKFSNLDGIDTFLSEVYPGHDLEKIMSSRSSGRTGPTTFLSTTSFSRRAVPLPPPSPPPPPTPRASRMEKRRREPSPILSLLPLFQEEEESAISTTTHTNAVYDINLPIKEEFPSHSNNFYVTPVTATPVEPQDFGILSSQNILALSSSSPQDDESIQNNYTKQMENVNNSTFNMNPNKDPLSLFSSQQASWADRSILPTCITDEMQRNWRRSTRSSYRKIEIREGSKIPVNCKETILPLDYRQLDYVELTTSEKYYSQGIKVIDGNSHIVIYTKIDNV